MRFLIVDNGYPQFFDWLYRLAQPGLAAKDFETQRRAYYDTLFGTSDFYVHALKSLGHDAEQFIYNCDPMQLAWRREYLEDSGRSLNRGLPDTVELVQRVKESLRNSFARRLLASLARPFLAALYRKQLFGFDLFLEQVRRSRPDVLFIQSLYLFDNEQLARLKQHARIVIGEQAVLPLADHIDYRNYDLIVSSFPPVIEQLRARGVRAELNRLAFDARVDDAIPQTDRDVPVGFVGSIFPMHSSRLPLLESIALAVPGFVLHGNVTIPVAATSPLTGRVHPPLWGRDMYAFLRRSKITINHHGDVLPYANNMRMYEATGMGCLLVTDSKPNLGEMFEPDKEVVTYGSAEECVDKVRFYLDDRNESARQAIMAAGHRRTLAEHTYASRMRRLVDLIG